MLSTKSQSLALSKNKQKPEQELNGRSILSIYKRVYSFLQTPSIHFENEIAKATLRFVSTCQHDFLHTHSHVYLSRLIGTLYFFEKELVKRIQAFPDSRHLLFRILKVPSSSSQQSQFGLIIATNLIQECEVFHQNHVLKAVRRIIPGIKEVPDSLYFFHDHKQSLVLLYIEIKKTRGKGFSLQEMKKLKELLLEELKLSVECLSHSLFFPRNEEEIYRNIVQLSRELKFTKDLPQVMISFQEQNGEWLRFTVIALRIFKPTSRPWQEMSIALPRSIRFTLEQVSKLGTLRKKHPKEAAVFTFEVESSLFLRKNHSIDLRLAREYLARALKLMIGDFRDYNGGFLSKQNEQLEAIKTSLKEGERKQSFFVETLFYSLTPPLIQTVLLPKAGKALMSLFLEALKQEIPSQKTYLLLHQEKPEYVVAILKTQQEKIEEFLAAEILKIPFHSYQFGHAFQQIDGFSYLCFVYQHPADFQLISFLKEAFEKWEQEKVKQNFHLKQSKPILKINFQGGDPPSLNPHIGIELRCRSLQKSLFEGLTRLNPRGFPEMAAAEKVTISPCQKHYVFKLRRHQWSNGEEVTAHDFEKTWKKAITFSSHCLRPDIFYIIQNAKEVHLGQLPEQALGVRALDASTLEVVLAYPSPSFLELLAHPLFFPLYEEGEEPMVFNGPFILRAWDRDHSLSLARNPYYWDAKNVFLSGIDITVNSDSREAFQMYQRGELDWIGDPFSSIPLEEVPALIQSGELKSKDVLGVSWLYCNTAYYPLSSSKIRRALSYALNRHKICETIFFGHTPLRSPLPKNMSFLKEEELYRDGDIEAARILFAEGIKDLDISLDSFASLTLNHSHIPGQKELAAAVCAQWKQAFNINVQTAEKSWSALTTIFDKREYHIGGCYRHFFYNDPFYIFNLFKEPTNVHNASGWRHRQFQECVNLANATSSFEERLAYLSQAEQILLEEMPVIPTHHITAQYLTREKLKGIHLCHSGDVDFKWVYFDD